MSFVLTSRQLTKASTENGGLEWELKVKNRVVKDMAVFWVYEDVYLRRCDYRADDPYLPDVTNPSQADIDAAFAWLEEP